MSKVAVTGNASGSGVFTITSPNSNSDRTLTLPDSSGTLLTTGLTGGFSFRNKIINGDMRVDQRYVGASAAVTGGMYTVDRWRSDLNGTYSGRFSSQQVEDAPNGFYQSLKKTITTVDTTNNASSYYLLDQPIEGYNVQDLGYGTADAWNYHNGVLFP
jgi:hypothetical protein